jgi:hypothetical protein
MRPLSLLLAALHPSGWGPEQRITILGGPVVYEIPEPSRR